MKLRLGLVVLVLAVVPASAQVPALICYGNEPSWSLELSEATARFRTAGEEETDLTGASTTLPALKVQAWRGRAKSGRGDVVAFLSESACSDGLSDAKRPYAARVSLPDGRLFAGCCRPDTLRAARPSGDVGAGSPGPAPAQPAPPPSAQPAAPPPAQPAALGFEPKPEGKDDAKSPKDWAASLEDYVPALKWCTYEALRTEAVLFAETLPKGKMHLVLRLPGRRYADCETSVSGPARVSTRRSNAPLSPAEQAVILILLPGQAPRGPCDRTEPALDDRGNPFGWITRKGC